MSQPRTIRWRGRPGHVMTRRSVPLGAALTLLCAAVLFAALAARIVEVITA